MRWLALVLTLLTVPAAAEPVYARIGRTEVRVTSAPFPLLPGRTVAEYALADRLDRLGYRRVREFPDTPGAYFWGNDVFWVHRRAHRADGRDWPARVIGLALSDGVVVGGLEPDGTPLALGGRGLWLEPEILAESVAGDRARRERISLSALPEHVWRPLLALEDARFFDHAGVDGKAIARAALANVKKGGVAQGGSTLTQQLVKNRDLTPKRTLDRKASEAVRALALEAEHTKEEILEAYLNTVYYGHVHGVAVHGIGAAARAYFSKPAHALTLAEAATLAAIVQGPNGLSPIRHPDRARARRDHALRRMEELGWASGADVRRAASTPVTVDVTPPRRRNARHFRDHVLAVVGDERERRLERGLGFVAETTLDPYLQDLAEDAVTAHVDRLRRRTGHDDLTAALVALDADTGEVLAYVGGHPPDRDDFDRARRAERQPGSVVKPLVLLEAFDDCGPEQPLTPATRVSDAPLTLPDDGGEWTPQNADRRHHGVVDLRTALRASYNLPFVRVTRHCGVASAAKVLERAGLPMPSPVPASVALGSVEATPLQVAGAFTAFGTLGRVSAPTVLRRVERPGGGRLVAGSSRSTRVSRPASAFLVRALLEDAVANGTGRSAALPGVAVAGKTGTTPRDAWFAGIADDLVVTVWIGRDGGGPLGLSGGGAAAPLYRDFAESAVPARPPLTVARPLGVVTRRIDPDTGQRVATPLTPGEEELFRRGVVPDREALLGESPPADVIE